MTNTNGNGNRPTHKIAVGATTVAIWTNVVQTAEGQRNMERVTIDRRYKDKDGQWQSTGSFNTSDLPRLILALQEAYKWLAMKKRPEEDDDGAGLA